MTTDRRTKKRRKDCYEVAMRRARRARRTGLIPSSSASCSFGPSYPLPSGLEFFPCRLLGETTRRRHRTTGL